ncbi:MAG: hypothetical protein GF408_07345 [Candidatus Omnitrophica bacterium]|nr:hypothetical protein [Candidatus Omnitrophota bacterium]
MKKKRFLHGCELNSTIYGKKGGPRKKVDPVHNRVSPKDVKEVYEKFYKDQVAALYRAVNRDK